MTESMSLENLLPEMEKLVQEAGYLHIVPYYSPPFDSLEYSNSSNLDLDLTTIKKVFENSRGTIVDAACGWGRVALDLAAQGHKVIAVDNSETAVNNLRSLAEERGYVSDNLKSVISDCNLFLKKHNEEFEGIVMGALTVNSFRLDELTELFLNIRSALAANGRFVLSTLKSRELPQLKELNGDTFQVEWKSEDGKKFEMITALSFSESTGKLIQNCYIPKNDLSESIFSSIEEMMWNASEVEDLLFKVGFQIEKSNVVLIPDGGLQGAEVVIFDCKKSL